tara:strand:+ start:77 stop:553 length:477 start_codon:yes stop_codon:yes gene_type:complete
MDRVQDSQLIPVHPEDTWNLIRDLELRPIWDETVSQVRRDGNFLYYVAPLFIGLNWYWTGEYVTFDPPNRSAIKMVSGSSNRPFKSLVGTWIITPSDQNTLLSMNISFEPRFPIPLLGLFMRRRVKKLLRKSLSQLSDLAVTIKGSQQLWTPQDVSGL